ncbi:YdcH family protein [Alteromonas sp. CYL-A6]|uniref:YdcH family protein n=1 Tax=Alteromonas nitratireducens TaxID=3390813 RepID=UPI0034B42A95
MPLSKHDFLSEFSDHHHTIRHLKLNDAHFAKLFEKYNDIDQNIFRIESGAEACSDDVLEQKKRERVHLKDTLFDLVKQEEAAQ